VHAGSLRIRNDRHWARSCRWFCLGILRVALPCSLDLRESAESKSGVGGRYRIRTYDFHRVKNEVIHLTPFSSLVFPHRGTLRNPMKRDGFGDESVTSRFWLTRWRSSQTVANSDTLFLLAVEINSFPANQRPAFSRKKISRSNSHTDFSTGKCPSRRLPFLQGNSRKCIHDPF
jgi:hypothetical protein